MNPALRGKCREYAQRAACDDPTLRVVRGWYVCPFWGRQAHWWCERPDGTIYDPTVDQFPSQGMGDYEEFQGVVTCASCGKEIQEADAVGTGRYPCCSHTCLCNLVM
jgi:hypothetical protein